MNGPSLPKSLISDNLPAQMSDKGCMLSINRTSVILIGVYPINQHYQNFLSPSSDNLVLLYNFILNSWTPHSSYPKGVDQLTAVTCAKVSDKNYQKYVLSIKSVEPM